MITSIIVSHRTAIIFCWNPRLVMKISITYVFLGFGVLMKGPAVVINIFCSLAAYVLYSRCWRNIKWVSFIVTLPVSLCLSLWWYKRLIR